MDIAGSIRFQRMIDNFHSCKYNDHFSRRSNKLLNNIFQLTHTCKVVEHLFFLARWLHLFMPLKQSQRIILKPNRCYALETFRLASNRKSSSISLKNLRFRIKSAHFLVCKNYYTINRLFDFM